MNRITLNADVGELPARIDSGDDAALIALIDDANIACGGHAGDDGSMASSVRACLAHDTAIGAHPSYPDRAGFGRSAMGIAPAELALSLRAQLQSLQQVAVAAGSRVSFVKPHGALYHDVGRDPALATLLLSAVRDVVGDVPLVLFWRAPVVAALQAAGARVRREAFGDRGTDDHDQLLPRGADGAVLGADDAVVQWSRVQARAAALGTALDTVCVHGDGPEALAVAGAISALLR